MQRLLAFSTYLRTFCRTVEQKVAKTLAEETSSNRITSLKSIATETYHATSTGSSQMHGYLHSGHTLL